MPTVEENEREFERMGLARVRILINTSGLPQHMMSDAIQWVARGEEHERQRQLAFETEYKQRQLAFETEQKQRADEQRQIARSSLKAAWIAVIVSIIAVIIACFSWLFPRA